MPNETNASADATSADGERDATAESAGNAGQGGSSTGSSKSTATGDDGALGEGGKRALEAERTSRKAAEDRAKAFEKELADLKAASLSDTEKAIADAKKAGATEASTRMAAQIRRSEVKAALTAAGVSGSLLDLAARADEFAKLVVSDDGEIEGLESAVKAFKDSHPDVFTKPAAAGTADGGTRGGKGTVSMEQATAWAKDPVLYEQHRDEIFAAMAKPK